MEYVYLSASLVILLFYFIYKHLKHRVNKIKEAKLDRELEKFDDNIQNLLEESFERKPSEEKINISDVNFSKETGYFHSGRIDPKFHIIIAAGLAGILFLNNRKRR